MKSTCLRPPSLTVKKMKNARKSKNPSEFGDAFRTLKAILAGLDT